LPENFSECFGVGKELIAKGTAVEDIAFQPIPDQAQIMCKGENGDFVLILEISVDGPLGQPGCFRQVFQTGGRIALFVEDMGHLFDNELFCSLRFAHF
jgi:hypothetical protein